MIAAPAVFEAIGTTWRIDLPGLASRQTERLITRVRERIALFDVYYSRFRADSLVSRMSREAGTYELPTDAGPLFSFYRELYEATGGAMTPLIGGTLVEAGYDAAYSLAPKTLHAPPAWDDVMEVGADRIVMRRPALLDFGAAGKGYLIDLVGELLRDAGLREFGINAGGDILHESRGETRIRIGLEDPDDAERVIGVYELGNGSICASAGNRRAWAGYHHILDPRTLRSPGHLRGVWTTARTAMLADGMSTCLFLVTPDRLAQFDFAYLLMHEDRSVTRSPSCNAHLFT